MRTLILILLVVSFIGIISTQLPNSISVPVPKTSVKVDDTYSPNSSVALSPTTVPTNDESKTDVGTSDSSNQFDQIESENLSDSDDTFSKESISKETLLKLPVETRIERLTHRFRRLEKMGQSRQSLVKLWAELVETYQLGETPPPGQLSGDGLRSDEPTSENHEDDGPKGIDEEAEESVTIQPTGDPVPVEKPSTDLEPLESEEKQVEEFNEEPATNENQIKGNTEANAADNPSEGSEQEPENTNEFLSSSYNRDGNTATENIPDEEYGYEDNGTEIVYDQEEMFVDEVFNVEGSNVSTLAESNEYEQYENDGFHFTN